MKKQRKSNLLYRLCCLLMAMHIINVSIDAPDPCVSQINHGIHREDLAVNEIESVTELLLEHVFGLTDAIPEHDDGDDDSESTELEQDYDFIHLFVFAPLQPVVQEILTDSVPFLPEPIPVHVQEILAPPPQVTA